MGSDLADHRSTIESVSDIEGGRSREATREAIRQAEKHRALLRDQTPGKWNQLEVLNYLQFQFVKPSLKLFDYKVDQLQLSLEFTRSTPFS